MPTAKTGREFWVTNGGRVAAVTAAKILERRDVQPVDPGLFGGFPQSWGLSACFPRK
jgi:hypothetical protein